MVPSGLDDDLTTYYTAEALAGVRRELGSMRSTLRAAFADLLHAEGRSHIVDVGAGPGLDVAEWQRDGFGAVGVDLVPANVELMLRRGLVGVVGSIYDLPLASGSFDAMWTMSTLVHVPDDRIDSALAELVRVVAGRAPLGIGTWGGPDFEGVPEFGELRPYRFFSLRGHQRWLQMLRRHGSVDAFDTIPPDSSHDWEYQFAVLRAPG